MKYSRTQIQKAINHWTKVLMESAAQSDPSLLRGIQTTAKQFRMQISDDVMCGRRTVKIPRLLAMIARSQINKTIFGGKLADIPIIYADDVEEKIGGFMTSNNLGRYIFKLGIDRDGSGKAIGMNATEPKLRIYLPQKYTIPMMLSVMTHEMIHQHQLEIEKDFKSLMDPAVGAHGESFQKFIPIAEKYGIYVEPRCDSVKKTFDATREYAETALKSGKEA